MLNGYGSRNDEPEAFEAAVVFERDMQRQMAKLDRIDSIPYLHSERKPLDKINFRHERQSNMFGQECEGLCGV
jgi:hypothetical protein